MYISDQMLKIPKKNMIQAVVNIKTKKLCLLTQFSVKVLSLGTQNEYVFTRQLAFMSQKCFFKVNRHLNLGGCIHNTWAIFQFLKCLTKTYLKSYLMGPTFFSPFWQRNSIENFVFSTQMAILTQVWEP